MRGALFAPIAVGVAGCLDWLAPAIASAHPDGAEAGATTTWLSQAAEVAVLGAIGALYVTGHWQLRRRGATSVTTVRIVAFVSGLVVLAASLAPPVEGAAFASLAAHMTQHLLLVVVAAPLLAIGQPLVALSGLGSVGRRLARSAGRSFGLLIARPVIVWMLNASVLALWHTPRLFEAALGHAALHAAEHATLIGAATLFWAVLVEPAGRRMPAFGVVYLFAASLQCGAIGALMATSDAIWYPRQTPSAARGAALADQQLAGTLMWIPASGVYLCAAVVVLARSLSSPQGLSSRHDRAR
jgi:putative membrane protein